MKDRDARFGILDQGSAIRDSDAAEREDQQQRRFCPRATGCESMHQVSRDPHRGQCCDPRVGGASQTDTSAGPSAAATARRSASRLIGSSIARRISATPGETSVQ